MLTQEDFFKHAKIDFEKLPIFGFVKQGEDWIYEENFLHNNFSAVIKISKDGAVFGDVYESDTHDIFLPLRVKSMNSAYINEVREAYQEILQKIKDNCCEHNKFITPQANRLTLAIYNKYGDNPIFPWEKYSGYGVFKNPENNKWYGLLGNIDHARIDKNHTGETEILNIKLEPDKIQNLLQEKGFYPAYHMNKKNWITIVLNDALDDDLILKLIDESHAFTLKKSKK